MDESHIITWFAPERPVENGTVHVRPTPQRIADPGDPTLCNCEMPEAWMGHAENCAQPRNKSELAPTETGDE